MVKILDNAATYLNIAWCNPMTGDLELVQMGELLVHSRPMALMAMNIVAMVEEMTALCPSEFIVTVQHHPETGAGFWLSPATYLTPEEEKEVAEKLRAFFEIFVVHCEEEIDLDYIDEENCSVNFYRARGLMHALESFYNDNEDLVTPADTDSLGYGHETGWVQAAGAECLSDAWVFALMTERAHRDMDALHVTAHRTGLANVPFDFNDIEEAVIETEKRAEQSDHQERKMAAYNPNGMRLH